MDMSNEELKANQMSEAEREVVEKIESELQNNSNMERSEKSAKEEKLALHYYESLPKQVPNVGPCKAHQELAKQQIRWLNNELQKSTSVLHFPTF